MSGRTRVRIFWLSGAMVVLLVFGVSAFTYYREARRQWLGSASTRQLLDTLEKSPEDTEVLYAAARRLWEREGKPEKALPLARQAFQRTNGEPESHLLLGYVTLANDLPAEALYHFEEVCRRQPDQVHAHAAAGAIYLDGGMPEKALPHLRRAWNLREPQIAVRFNTIEALYLTGEWEEADRLALEAVRYAPPGNVLPYKLLYRINKKLGRPEKVKQMMLQQVARDFPLTAPFYAETGFVLMEEGGLTERELIEKMVQKALKYAWGDPEAYSIQGALLAKQGRHEEALAPLRKAVTLGKDNRRARRLLAASLRALGREAEARRYDPVVPPPLSVDAVRRLRAEIGEPRDADTRLAAARRLEQAGDYLGAFEMCWPQIGTDGRRAEFTDLGNRVLSLRIAQQKLTRL